MNEEYTEYNLDEEYSKVYQELQQCMVDSAAAHPESNMFDRGPMDLNEEGGLELSLKTADICPPTSHDRY